MNKVNTMQWNQEGLATRKADNGLPRKSWAQSLRFFWIKTLLLLVAAGAMVAQAGSESENRFGFNAKWVGLTFHPDGGENQGYPLQLDDGAYFVVQLGLQADADYYLHRWFLLRATTSLYKDCALVWAGYNHIGFRVNVPIGERFVFRVGIGPTQVWRQNWLGKVDGYVRDSFFGKGGPGAFQDKFLWYGGDLDFEWKIRDNWSFVYGMIPGWPEVITNNIGGRYSF
jgi:hypothetical protein